LQRRTVLIQTQRCDWFLFMNIVSRPFKVIVQDQLEIIKFFTVCTIFDPQFNFHIRISFFYRTCIDLSRHELLDKWFSLLRLLFVVLTQVLKKIKVRPAFRLFHMFVDFFHLYISCDTSTLTKLFLFHQLVWQKEHNVVVSDYLTSFKLFPFYLSWAWYFLRYHCWLYMHRLFIEHIHVISSFTHCAFTIKYVKKLQKTVLNPRLLSLLVLLLDF